MDLKRAAEVCREIAKDIADDAAKFDGKPFTGRTVAEYFGNHGAAIAALAGIVEKLCEANAIFGERAGFAADAYEVDSDGVVTPPLRGPIREA